MKRKGYFRNVINESYLNPRGEADSLLKQLERRGFYSGPSEAKIKFSNLAHTVHGLLGGSLHDYKLDDKQREIVKQIGKLVLSL